MHNDTHDLRVSARTARLTAGSDSDAGPPYRFSGVAVAAGDILHMDDGTPVLFTEEELRKAAETQADEPLTVDHPTDDDGRPVYPPPTDETVGKVPKAGWLDEQAAVGYEATAHDEEIAQGVQAGSYEVSVHPTFELGEQDPETGAYIAENIAFRDLSVVSKGDSPSNTAEWGPNQALASYTQSTDIGAELDGSADGTGDADRDRESLVSSTVRGTLRALGFSPTDVDHDIPGTAGEHELVAAELVAGTTLAQELEEAIEANTSEDRTRADVVDDLSEEAGIDTGTVNAILRAEIDCPPLSRLDGFATALDTDLDSLVAAAEEDGCNYGDAAASASDGRAGSRTGSSTSPMDDDTREQYVQFLTANADFDEESVTAMDDDVLEQTYELAADGAAGDADGDGGSTTDGDGGSTTNGDDDGGRTLGEMTVDELGEAMREQGFVTEDNAGDLLEEATAQATKREKVDEIIANSDEYDEDDREALLSSAESLVDREHKRVRGELAAQLPGAAGAAATLTADSTGGDDVDEYGTGVQED